MKKIYSPQEARGRIQQYCAYQERCHQEVRSRLFEYGLSGNDAEEIITELITEGFLNEERYARTFAGGKFRIKKWGRIKIVQGLESKGVSSYCIRSALKEIDNEDYDQTLHTLLGKKNEEIAVTNVYVRRDRLSKYAIQRGYEPELVWKILRVMIPDQ